MEKDTKVTNKPADTEQEALEGLSNHLKEISLTTLESPAEHETVCKKVTSEEEGVLSSESQANQSSEEDASGEEYEDASSDEPWPLEPWIAMPPLVIPDGDDDEIVIVAYRAKLYRFDSGAKEWKEAGLGSIKLLQRKGDPSRCRVVMWRDAVGYVACNFGLFPEISITNFQDNPKALCWKCFNFTCESAEWETFTCRFASEENCTDFKQKLLQYAREVVPVNEAKNTSAESENEIECSGCIGCEPDSYVFPNHTQKKQEILIDVPLDTSSCTSVPQ